MRSLVRFQNVRFTPMRPAVGNGFTQTERYKKHNPLVRLCPSVPTDHLSNKLSRKDPSLREDLKLGGEQLQHPVEVPGQQILPADFEHPGEVIDFLEPSHVPAEIDPDERVRPAHVPQFIFGDQSVAEPTADSWDDVVATVQYANTDWRSATNEERATVRSIGSMHAFMRLLREMDQDMCNYM